MLCNAKIRFTPEALTVLTLANKHNSNNNNNNEMNGLLTEDSPSSEHKQTDRHKPPTPTSSSSSSSSSSGSSAWQQFLQYHHLAPCRILIAGASGSGKTALAKGLSNEFELKYVDVLETLRWVAVSSSSGSSGDDTSSSTTTTSSSAAASTATATTSSAADVKKALLDLMTAKLQEGLKKGAPPVVCDPLTFDFSDAFVALVPLPLVRKALALRIATCSHCQIKGFVLDVWQMADLVGDVNDFLELLNLNNNSNNNNSRLVSVPDPTSTTSGESGPTEITLEKIATDVIVVEVDSAVKSRLMDRYTKSLGVSETDNKAKLSKEIQASLKVMTHNTYTYIGTHIHIHTHTYIDT